MTPNDILHASHILKLVALIVFLGVPMMSVI